MNINVDDLSLKSNELFQEFLRNNPGRGYLKIRATAASEALPVSGVSIVVSKKIGNDNIIFFTGQTDNSGMINGIVRTYDIVQTIDYELDGKTISESVVINYTLHANYTPINGGDRVTEFSYEIPDKDAEKYKEVKDIYDL